jgi:hypothetical protein
MHQREYRFWVYLLSNRSHMFSMRKRMRSFVKQFLLCLISPGIFCLAQHEQSTDHVRSALAQQGFSGELDGKIGIHLIGALNCGTNRLQVYFYEWEEANPPGKAVHSISRILLFSGKDQYLGSYVVSDRPTTLTSDALKFEYPEDAGNTIRCTQNKPPRKVLLNGELQEFAK